MCCDLLCFKSEVLQACWDLMYASVNLWQFKWMRSTFLMYLLNFMSHLQKVMKEQYPSKA